MRFRAWHGFFAAPAAFLATGAHGLSQLQIENAAVGRSTLIITIDDSVRAPDLSKIRVEGYEIENALFVEESGPAPRFAPNYIDLTAPGKGKVVEYAPGPGTLILEMPIGSVPLVGAVLGDTAFGGLLRKVVEVDPQPQPGMAGKRWLLRTVEADLPEAVLECDIAFRTRLDLNQSLADLAQAHDLAGSALARDPATGESPAAFARLDLGMKSAQILFQPTVSGRLQVRGGRVEVFNFVVTGDCEVGGEFRAALAGAGEFEFEEELPAKAPQILPLGSGLFVRMQNRPFLRVEARSAGQSFLAHGDMRIRNSIKGELGFRDGQWRPLAENKMAWANRSLHALSGDGSLRIALKPRVEMLLEGTQGPVFTFEPFARFTATPALPLPGWAAPALGEGLPAAPGLRPFPTQEPRTYGAGNKELRLGANIFMESRTDFAGPSSLRNFLLFSREQTVLSPPSQGVLAFLAPDSNRLPLQIQTYPKSDWYVIQQRLGNGPWETLLDKATVPRIPIASLKPSTAYRFRAIGVNALGVGPAFPPEGLAFTTPAANRAPFLAAAFPDSGAVLPDSLPVGLAWKGGDPDAGAKVEYSVYLDTRFPPLTLKADKLADTSLILADLKPGVTYWWKVVASDGVDRSEGPARSFTVSAPPPRVAEVPHKGFPEYYPLVFVPKGSFRRQDGRVVQVGPLFMGKYEITQAEFTKQTGRNPSYRLQDSLPVDRVTWDEAEAFCRETGGRLPTEAEWEYAARAGSGSSFYWGAENPRDYAWYRDNSDNRTQKVGLKKANAWGFHDMAGNVFEWVQDWYGDYNPAELDHPKGPAAGTARVIRGASWYSETGSLSLSARYNNRPGFRNFKVGFRCARDPERSAGAAWADPAGSLAGKTALPEARTEVSPPK